MVNGRWDDKKCAPAALVTRSFAAAAQRRDRPLFHHWESMALRPHRGSRRFALETSVSGGLE